MNCDFGPSGTSDKYIHRYMHCYMRRYMHRSMHRYTHSDIHRYMQMNTIPESVLCLAGTQVKIY